MKINKYTKHKFCKQKNTKNNLQKHIQFVDVNNHEKHKLNVKIMIVKTQNYKWNKQNSKLTHKLKQKLK